MKGVEAVRHQPAGGPTQAGVWLSLEALLQLPLSSAAQLELLSALVQGLDHGVGADLDECRAALLAALSEGELRQACRCFETGAWCEGRHQWQAALDHQQDLQALRPSVTGLHSLMEGLIQALARLDQTLTHRQWRPPASPLENAQVHGMAAELLRQIRDLDQPLPSWFAVVEEGLLRRGGLALASQSSGDSRREGIALLLRWVQCESVEPSSQQRFTPDWLRACLDQTVGSLLADLDQSSHPIADLQALLDSLAALPALVTATPQQALVSEALTLARGCLTLALEARQPLSIRESMGLQRGAAVAVAEIRALVGEWLEDHPAEQRPVALELVWIPGARPVPHGPGQLALNLWAVLPEGDGEPAQLEQVITAFFEPLRQGSPGPHYQLRHPTTSLLNSLRHLWNSGAALSASECQWLALSQALWQQLPFAPGRPGTLSASLLPAVWSSARLTSGCCLVKPSVTQLAGLRSWLLDRPRLSKALVEIRQHHHDPVFMQQQAACAEADRGNALENLCALHVEEGFYASGAAPERSVQAWAEISLAQLGRSQWLVDPQPPTGSWWAVLQAVAQQQNHGPDLVDWPEDHAFYGWLAGQEVLLISPLAALVEEQHRSGRAFELFLDLPIAPYGLRTLAPPESLYPGRPHQGFEASLAACLDSLEALVRQRPFGVFLTAAGAYDLPLCQAVMERYGASCVAIGPGIHARFGIDQVCSRHWRPGRRRGDRWRRIC